MNDMKYPLLQALQAWKMLAQPSLAVWNRGTARLLQTVCECGWSIYEEVCADIAPVKVAKKNPKYKKNFQGTMSIERDCLLAAMFLDGADKKQYGFLLKQLQNDYSLAGF